MILAYINKIPWPFFMDKQGKFEHGEVLPVFETVKDTNPHTARSSIVVCNSSLTPVVTMVIASVLFKLPENIVVLISS